MNADEFSWCRPDKKAPPGVQGASATSSDKTSSKTSSKPRKVFPWNVARDNELRELETLTRDGLYLGNATVIAFAYLLNGIFDPTRALPEEALRHTLFTVNDLVHAEAENFARVAHRIALFRKLNVIRSLNVADQTALTKSPMGGDMFDGQWPKILKDELARRKQQKEKAKKDREEKAARDKRREEAF